MYKCRNIGNIRNRLHSFGSTIMMIHSVRRPLPRARPKSHSLAVSHAVIQASELWIRGSWIFLASKCQFWISQAAWYRNSSWPERMLVKKDQLDTYYSGIAGQFCMAIRGRCAFVGIFLIHYACFAVKRLTHSLASSLCAQHSPNANTLGQPTTRTTEVSLFHRHAPG